MALADKSESQKIFEKLKLKPANKVSSAKIIYLTMLGEIANILGVL